MKGIVWKTKNKMFLFISGETLNRYLDVWYNDKYDYSYVTRKDDCEWIGNVIYNRYLFNRELFILDRRGRA